VVKLDLDLGDATHMYFSISKTTRDLAAKGALGGGGEFPINISTEGLQRKYRYR
jgi:hypothetical protein